jgi:hypothetical protein
VWKIASDPEIGTFRVGQLAAPAPITQVSRAKPRWLRPRIHHRWQTALHRWRARAEPRRTRRKLALLSSPRLGYLRPTEGERKLRLMDHGYRMLGFVVVVILYAVISLMAATGTIFIARKILAPKAEQIFYAKFLIMIAAFYLAFAAYLGVASAWRLETAVVVAFVAIALPGASLPFALILGYSLHGLWDLLHELQAHRACSAFEPASSPRCPLPTEFLCSL